MTDRGAAACATRRPSAAGLGVTLVLAFSLGLALAPGRPAWADEGLHCAGQAAPGVFLDHAVYATVEPLGLDHRLQLYRCAPLVRRPGILFALTNVKAGAELYLSPTQAVGGAFASITPLSVLVLRAEVTGAGFWPIPLSGTGLIPLAGYRPFDEAVLDPPASGPGAAGAAWGLRAVGTATLQARVPLGNRAALLLGDVFAVERWRLGDASHYYNARLDAVMAASDWALWNTVVLLLSRDLGRTSLRVGLSDDFVKVPAGEDVSNALMGMASLVLPRAGAARIVHLFVRAGGYTHHAFRRGPTASVGVEITWDVRLRR